VTERKSFFEKIAEWSKKLDILLIGSGILLLYFVPGVGAAVIIGSAITIVPAEILSRWAKKRKQK